MRQFKISKAIPKLINLNRLLIILVSVYLFFEAYSAIFLLENDVNYLFYYPISNYDIFPNDVIAKILLIESSSYLFILIILILFNQILIRIKKNIDPWGKLTLMSIKLFSLLIFLSSVLQAYYVSFELYHYGKPEIDKLKFSDICLNVLNSTNYALIIFSILFLSLASIFSYSSFLQKEVEGIL